MQHTVTYNTHQYVVNCAREVHCGYVRTTIFITKVLDKTTGNPVQYPKRISRDPLSPSSVTIYYTIEESMIRHLQFMTTKQELDYVMGAAERHFAQHN